MSLKLKLKRLIKSAQDKSKITLCLLNRSKNKLLFLKTFREMLIKEELNLLDFSKIFMRINNIYKQASIERQSVKKKSPGKLQFPKII